MRFAPQLSTQKGLTQRQVISAALEGLRESDLHTNLILCCMRGNDVSTHRANMETIELAHEFLVEDGGVVAVDLAGAEAIFPTHLFKREFDAAKKYSIPYTIHAGEAAGAISVQEALELGAYRIGHGIRSIEDEKVLDRIIQEGIPLECCPTSNKITKAIENMNDYPLRELLSRGVKVTVNTDDMAICRTRLSKEFEYIRETFKITAEEEKQLYLNAVEAAFCSKQTKDELRALIS
ncbi:MAG: adenosine deaminase family protein [Treponema sp.]|nr:adenosine deaminase family protein [Treponema sp.]